tara:strand:- start:67 stop:372 length:306 start_codon:yes stop_codon:yes gene_type:complete
VAIPLPKPVRRLIDQCETGFTVGKKLKLTLITLVYLVSFVDLVPDVLLPFGVLDDGVALFLLVKVWCSPTLASGRTADADIMDTPPSDAVPVRNTAHGGAR